jgi:hypothetical protein
MELSRDPRKQTKILKKYSTSLFAKWIPSCYVDENNCIQAQDNLDKHIPHSGRWGVYEKGKVSGKTYLLYIVEWFDHSYREVHENIDFLKLHEMDEATKGYMNPANYNAAEEINYRNQKREEKMDKNYRELVRERAREMYNFITNTPVITAGTPWR